MSGARERPEPRGSESGVRLRLRPREGPSEADLVFDPRAERLWRDGDAAGLPPRARSVLAVLLAGAGRVVDREELLRQAWGDRPISDSAVADAVADLRRALGDDPRQPRFIQTVPKRGYRFIGDVDPVDDRAGASDSPAGSGIAAVALLVGFLVAVVSFVAGGALRDSGTVPDRPLVAPLALSQPLRLDVRGGPAIALSADGTLLAHAAAQRAGGGHLQLVSLLDGSSRRLEGTEGAPASPFFSPDGDWVAFFDSGRLWRASTRPGDPRVEQIAVVPRRSMPAGDWSGDLIVVGPGRGSGLLRIDPGSGDVATLTELADGEEGHLWPALLPGGRGVVFSSPAPGGEDFRPAAIEYVGVDGAGRRTLLREGGIVPRYLSPDRLLFVDGEEVRIASLDVGSLTVGEPVSWRSGALSWRRGSAHVAVASTGDVALVTGPADLGPGTLYWLQLNSLNQWPLDLTAGRAYRGLEISPDGRHLATSIDGDLWTYEFRTDHFSRVAAGGALERSPAWRADSRTVTFAANVEADFDLFRVRRDRPGDVELLLDSDRDDLPSSWSPDDRTLAFTRMDPVTGADIYLLDAADGSVEALVRGPDDDRDARFSPDGRMVAFVSDRDGGDEIYVLAPGEDHEPVRITTGGGRRPRWDVDGGMILFRRGVEYASAPLRLGGSPRRGNIFSRWREPDPFFEFALTLDGGYKPLVARRDGTRFLHRVLLVRGASGQAPGPGSG